MQFLHSPNLPQSDIGLAAVSATYPEIIQALAHYGIGSIPVLPEKNLQGSIRCHADVLCHHLGEKNIVIAAGNIDLQSKLSRYGFTVLESEHKITSPYPFDSGLNAARIGKRLIASPSVLDPTILKYCRIHQIKIIPVRQGYAKCSAAVVDENSIITSDHGITDAAEKAGLNALLIRPGFIVLPGWNYGFIGGTCGKIGKNKIAFSGRIQDHPDFIKISEFLSRKNIEMVSLTDGPLIDIGGIVPLMER